MTVKTTSKSCAGNMQGKSVLLTVILAASFLVRILHLDYPLSETFWWGDSTRDYLVASHILKYQEFPLVGPYNLLFESGIRNSPLYFYALAAFLIPFNHPLTLSFFNIILQMLTLFLIFFLTKKMFGVNTALLATALLSFNPEAIKQSDYIWQPYLMHSVALLSLYFLIKTYFEENFKFYLVSLITLTLAFALHSSAFPWLPVFLLSGVIFLKNKWIKVFSTFSIIILSTLLFVFLDQLPPALTVKNWSDYFSNFNFNLVQLLNIFNVNYFFLFLLLLFIIFLLWQKKKIVDRKLFAVTFLLFLAPLVFASLFNKIRPHYLIASLVSFTIWVAVLANFTIPKYKALIFLVIFVIFTNNLNFLKIDKKPFQNLRYIENITDQLIKDLKHIKDEKKYLGFDFFQVHSLGIDEKVYDYPILDTILLASLERKLEAKLAKVSDNSPYNHVQTNKRDYIFLSCVIFNKSYTLDCVNEFTKRYGQYKLLKNVYWDKHWQIYLMQSLKPVPLPVLSNH